MPVVRSGKMQCHGHWQWSVSMERIVVLTRLMTGNKFTQMNRNYASFIKKNIFIYYRWNPIIQNNWNLGSHCGMKWFLGLSHFVLYYQITNSFWASVLKMKINETFRHPVGLDALNPSLKYKTRFPLMKLSLKLCYDHLHAGRQVIRWNWAMITAIDNQSDTKD